MLNLDNIISEVTVSITEWQQLHKTFKPAAAYQMNFWILQALKQQFEFFSIDKRLAEIYVFTEFGYQLITLREFSNYMRQIYTACDRMDYRNAYGNEIFEQLNNSCILPEEEVVKINYYPALIPLQDGIYSTITWERMSYDPKIYFTRRFNVVYSESSHCPEFRKFINRILPNRDLQLKVFSYLCYCMTPDVKLQISQVWTGGGKNGKTEFSYLLDLVMGPLVTHISMDTFMNNNAFVNSEMAFAWLNVSSEITPSNFKDVGITQMKRNITNKIIRKEAKFDTGVNYKNKCKQLIDANDLPLPNIYTDYAFFRRFQIIPFTEHIEEEEREFDIMERIFHEEGPQIVRFLLSFHDVMHEHLREDADEAERLWKWNCQSVFVFFDEYCTIGGMTKCEDAYEMFEQFCKHNNKQKVSYHHFGRLIKSMGIERNYMNKEEYGAYSDYDYRNRDYGYNMTVNYDQADDIVRNAQLKKAKQEFLKEVEAE